MTHGPCADVQADGACEVPEVACPFVALREAVEWMPISFESAQGREPGNEQGRFVSGVPTGSVQLAAPKGRSASVSLRPRSRAAETLLLKPQLIIAELPEPGNSAAVLKRSAARLGSLVDGALFGDANWSRVRFPPSYRAALALEGGCHPWPGLNCRDRNRVALEGELMALADLGIVGVHCVTGNHPYSGHRPDAKAVFDIDGTELIALASGMGFAVSTGESPASPPVSVRPGRASQKYRAGADICIVDQVENAEELAVFIANIPESARSLRVFASVPVLGSEEDRQRIAAYPNAKLPPPSAIGVVPAIARAKAMLEVPGVSGILLGSTGGIEDADRSADLLAQVAAELRVIR
jgi:5,10-methylenetetrahydrofolate reductase